MKIEFRPHVEVGSNGSKSYSEVFPFVNGQPANQIASCGYCTLNRDESECCDGWVDDKENAPFFCGPICTKFDPTSEAVDLIEAMEI
ncbi:TPA: hypothetical protein ACKPFN_003667 [Pseudomonas aeruginosa]